MFEDIAAVGFDLAKRVFQVHAVSVEGSVAIRRKLRRGEATCEAVTRPTMRFVAVKSRE